MADSSFLFFLVRIFLLIKYTKHTHTLGWLLHCLVISLSGFPVSPLIDPNKAKIISAPVQEKNAGVTAISFKIAEDETDRTLAETPLSP